MSGQGGGEVVLVETGGRVRGRMYVSSERTYHRQAVRASKQVAGTDGRARTSGCK